MSVNTSEEYLDELLQAIEPIINPEQEKPAEEPVVASVADMAMELTEELVDGESLSVEGLEEEMEVVGDEFPVFEEEQPVQEPVMSDNAYYEEENAGDINDLLASLAGEELDSVDEEGMSEEDVESMLSAMSSQSVPDDNEASYDEDVKELLKQFTENEDLSDIQDILDKNDNGEALDNSMLDLPDVEVFQMEEDGTEEEEEDGTAKGGSNPISKIIGGFAGLFKRKKNKRKNSEEEDLPEAKSDIYAVTETEEYAQPDSGSESELEDIDGMALEDMLGEDVEDLVFDEDLTDIEQLLSGGSITEVEEYGEDNIATDAVKVSGKKAPKSEKKSFFAKILDALTEEIDEPAMTKGRVPEAGKTGVTKENLDILQELSAEDSKKEKKAKKAEKQNKKAKKDGKNTSKKGEGEAEDNAKTSKGKKSQKAKKPKKIREKKVKTRKTEEVTKPEKKLPKRRALSAMALCLSILAAVLILEGVVSKSDNLKEAKYAYDSGDYATCFANLEIVDRSEEEESLYQKSLIIMSVQRKWDAYNNFVTMNNGLEALNSLLEGVAEYWSMEEAAIEWGVHAQITAIYQNILEALQGYGLSQDDIDEILGYESKVTYTKRVDSIVNGTPFVIEDMSESTVSDEPQPLQDVLPGEEDFLPDDTTLVNEAVAVESNDAQMSQSSGETVVVGSNPVDISSQDNGISYEEPVVTGGQNVGSGNTDMSVEVNGQNALIGVR